MRLSAPTIACVVPTISIQLIPPDTELLQIDPVLHDVGSVTILDYDFGIGVWVVSLLTYLKSILMIP